MSDVCTFKVRVLAEEWIRKQAEDYRLSVSCGESLFILIFDVKTMLHKK